MNHLDVFLRIVNFGLFLWALDGFLQPLQLWFLPEDVGGGENRPTP